MKLCPDCNEVKPIADFIYRKHRAGKSEVRCQLCGRAKRLANYHIEKLTDKYNTEENKKKRNEAFRRYHKKNRGLMNYGQSKKRANKDNRMPSWHTEEDEAMMLAVYNESAKLQEESTKGETFQVDHLVPLLGDLVCGLHVPSNLRIVYTTYNREKANKWDVNQDVSLLTNTTLFDPALKDLPTPTPALDLNKMRSFRQQKGR